MAEISNATRAGDAEHALEAYAERLNETGREELPTYSNNYTCDCGASWVDVWSCMCDDDCPTCGTTCTPESSTTAELPDDLKQQVLTDLLADLRHYATREGLNFEGALIMSGLHNEAEA